MNIYYNHNFSGYDFGYLLKILTNNNLPGEESEFFDLIKIFFPNIYDVKYLMKSCKNLKVSCFTTWKYSDFSLINSSLFASKGGLQEVAQQLEIERIGLQHQAGSDSLLTGQLFFKMREVRNVYYRVPIRTSVVIIVDKGMGIFQGRLWVQAMAAFGCVLPET